MMWFLALSLDFEGSKNIHILKVLIWGFGGCWRFLAGVLYLDLDFDMITGLWHTNDPNFGPLSWFWRCKEHACPLSPRLGIWRTLEVPDWDFASWSWLVYGYWSSVHPCSKFWLSPLILKVQRTSISFMSQFGAFEDGRGSWLGFGILICIWI